MADYIAWESPVRLVDVFGKRLEIAETWGVFVGHGGKPRLVDHRAGKAQMVDHRLTYLPELIRKRCLPQACDQLRLLLFRRITPLTFFSSRDRS
jgi:hypothetical protein